MGVQVIAPFLWKVNQPAAIHKTVIFMVLYFNRIIADDMELRHLRYFIAVADELSFSRAAERLHIAQPPLSQQIKALETELGVQLFNRTKRPLQLTEAGQAFVEEARSTLEKIDQAIRKTQRIQQGELGCLTVGLTSSMANGILPIIVRTFRRRHPETALMLRESNAIALAQGLRDRMIDAIFAYRTPSLIQSIDLDMTVLSAESLLAVLPERHRLTSKPTISLADLQDEEFIMPPLHIASSISEQVFALCAQVGFVPKVVQEAIFVVTILGLVSGEMGISILPSSVQSLRREGVAYRPIQQEAVANPLTIVRRKEKPSDSLAKFIHIAKEISVNQKNTLRDS